MFNFESPKPQDPKKPENDFEKKKLLFKNIEKIAKNALIWGMISTGGAYIGKGALEQLDYANHKETMKKENSAEYKKLEKEIVSEVGEGSLKEIESGDAFAFFEKSEERKNPTVRNFEKISLDSKTMKKVWSEEGSYPKNWINGAVETISYNHEVSNIGKEYGNSLEGSESDAQTDRHGHEIKIKANEDELKYLTKPEIAKSLDFKLGHELGHNNDWHTSRNLNLIERMELLAKVVKRMHSAKPFRSFFSSISNEKDYYQKIKPNNNGANQTLQAEEYWAQLCQYYFGAPEWMKDEFPEDYALVAEYVKKSDSAFNPQEAANKRNHIIDEKYK